MHTAIAFCLCAFLMCFALTPLCRDLCNYLEIVDHPDGVRKLQTKPIPRVGGVAIALSYAFTLALFLFVAPSTLHISVQHKTLLVSMLVPSTLVFFTGLVDDLWGLRPRYKLAGQTVAAVLAVSLGAHITLLGGHPASPWLTIPLSIVWLLACSNALNLIDGLDGLATGVALVATLTTLVAALLRGDAGLVMATAPLAACLLAFLCFNFSPASVYLGDCGSLTIGFLLGCFALIWSQKSATLVGMAAPMMMLSLPLLEVALTVGRRYLGSRPIFQPDREHIHHRLLALGCTPRDAALILYGVCGIAAVLSLLQGIVSARLQGLTIVAFCVLALIGIQRLNYAEFRLARRLISRRRLRQMLLEQTFVSQLAGAIDTSVDHQGCWSVLQSAAEQLHIAGISLHYDGYHFVTEAANHVDAWQLSTQLENRGRLTLTFDEAIQLSPPMAAAMGVLRHHLIGWRRVKQAPATVRTAEALPELRT